MGESGGEKIVIIELQDIPSAYTAENLGDTKPVIAIGGKTDKFVPNVNLSFKCGTDSEQYFINLNRPDVVVDSQTETVDDGAVTLTTGEQTDCFYVDAEGRLKWDIVFDEKPISNVFNWKIRKSPGVSFYYQGELTEEEKAEGCERPDWAVGSYAVYGDRSDNGFMTGKLMHIPRPFCIDANGAEQWADILVDRDWLSITIPQEYVDGCVYPMRLDPTFGLTSKGATSATSISNYIVAAGPEPAPENGAVDSVSWYINNTAGTIVGVTLGVYAHSSGSTPGSLLADGGSESIATGFDNWKTVVLDSSLSITSGVSYWPAFNKNNNITIYYDSVSSKYLRYAAQTYSAGTLTASPTWAGSGGIYDGKRYSAYITYTASGGATFTGPLYRSKLLNHPIIYGGLVA